MIFKNFPQTLSNGERIGHHWQPVQEFTSNAPTSLIAGRRPPCDYASICCCSGDYQLAVSVSARQGAVPSMMEYEGDVITIVRPPS